MDYDITVLIPVFNLSGPRLNNFIYTLTQIRSLGLPVLVIEQLNNDKKISGIINICKDLGARYERILINDTHIHKSKLINEGVKKIRTNFVWMNDADSLLNFKSILNSNYKKYDFVQPYKIAKKTTLEETCKIISNSPIEIEFCTSGFENKQSHISLPFALSFIFKKDSFLKIGGMCEKFVGWGYEDNEISTRILNIDNLSFKILKEYAIHLWHPEGINDELSTFNYKLWKSMHDSKNIKYFKNIHNSSINEDKVNILTLFRGNNAYLNNITNFLRNEDSFLDLEITWILNSNDSKFIDEAFKNAKFFNNIKIIINDKFDKELTSNYFDTRHEYVSEVYKKYLPDISSEYIITLEDDVLPPLGGVNAILIPTIRDNKIGATGSLYPLKQKKQKACFHISDSSKFMSIKRTHNKGIIDVYRLGGGFTCWKRSVLKKTYPVSFKRFNESYVEGWDWSSSRKIKELGKHLLLNTNVLCQHFN